MTNTEKKSQIDSDGNIVVEASRIKRLINFLIDFTVFGFLMIILGQLSREFKSLENIFLGLSWILMSGSYWILTEYFFRKTLGKYITKTKVVFKKDTKPEFRLMVIRTWARIIPFEFLSLLLGADAKAWHDVLSKTMVVDDQ